MLRLLEKTADKVEFGFWIFRDSGEFGYHSKPWKILFSAFKWYKVRMRKSHGGSLISATILNEKRSSTLSLGYCDLGLSHAISHETHEMHRPGNATIRIRTEYGKLVKITWWTNQAWTDRSGNHASVALNPEKSFGPTKWMFRNAAKNWMELNAFRSTLREIMIMMILDFEWCLGMHRGWVWEKMIIWQSVFWE